MSESGAVIVGAGIAGVSAAAGLRTAGFEGTITLIGDEPELPYRRPPVSKEIVRGDKTADEIRIRKADWYDTQQIELMTARTVTGLDPAGRVITLDDGERVRFDRLLLATGGRARTMTTSAPATGVRTLRTLADVPALQSGLTPGQQIVVVGAGLIGSEIAASARTLGCDVTLLETAALPMPKLLPPAIGQAYVDLHKGEGTELHTDVTVTDILDRDGETVVMAEDGRSWTAPLVVLAIGMVPATELAESAGLGTGNGIVVDAAGRTSAPGVFAAGDVANQPNLVLGGRHRVEHWKGAQNHGTAVGKAMAGADISFAEVPWCWSDQYGHNLQVAGWPASTDELVVRGTVDAMDFTAFFLRASRLVGAVTIGRPGDIRAIRNLIGQQAVVDGRALCDESIAIGDSVRS